MRRLAPLKVLLKLDEDGRIIQKDGKDIHICITCKKETTDLVEVFHGSCHRIVSKE